MERAIKPEQAAATRPDFTRLTRALSFAAEAHANQRRKGAAQEPYLNHLVEVLDLVAQATGGDDVDLLIASLLHDVVEDTSVTEDELTEAFGARVAEIVQANSDDMSLPKDQRRRKRIADMPHKSPDARIVKTADVISNIRAIVTSPPAGWTADRKLGYLEGCRQLIDAGRGANAALERVFDQTVADAERAIRGEAEGGPSAARQLDEVIGQPVHMVYLANTECREIEDSDIDKLCTLAARTFPSVTVQEADAIYEGRRRPILIARIRTHSTDSVVELAQRLCLAFDQRFVGVEVGGRYIRIYSDDTG
ncbi:MAG: HD domain-containing protein [Alphaproteobacteria bacterium]|nr:HD domain-containing protein [Alphaproteobacteria bacterium]